MTGRLLRYPAATAGGVESYPCSDPWSCVFAVLPRDRGSFNRQHPECLHARKSDPADLRGARTVRIVLTRANMRTDRVSPWKQADIGGQPHDLLVKAASRWPKRPMFAVTSTGDNPRGFTIIEGISCAARLVCSCMVADKVPGADEGGGGL